MNTQQKVGFEDYLGKNIRETEVTSSLMKSTSEWLNHPIVREVLPIWLLRKNGPDFPVEADHTLGLATAFNEVMPEEHASALFMAELEINPRLARHVEHSKPPCWSNEQFLAYPEGTVGGIMGHQIREHGFDLTLGMGPVPDDLSPFQLFRRCARLVHDFEHIVTGGQFTSIGEIVVTMARIANVSEHLSPKLASAVNVYQTFSGLRMFTRALLHYPEVFPTAIRCMEQGFYVGRNSPPFWEFAWEEVFDKTPEDARKHFGMPEVDFIESTHDEAIFRELVEA